MPKKFNEETCLFKKLLCCEGIGGLKGFKMKLMDELSEKVVGLEGRISEEGDGTSCWRREVGDALRFEEVKNLIEFLIGVGGDGCCVHNHFVLSDTNII